MLMSPLVAFVGSPSRARQPDEARLGRLAGPDAGTSTASGGPRSLSVMPVAGADLELPIRVGERARDLTTTCRAGGAAPSRGGLDDAAGRIRDGDERRRPEPAGLGGHHAARR